MTIKIGSLCKITICNWGDYFKKIDPISNHMEVYGDVITAPECYLNNEDLFIAFSDNNIYLNKTMTVIVLDVITNKFCRQSEILNKEIILNEKKRVLFLYNDKTYSLSEDVFETITEEIK